MKRRRNVERVAGTGRDGVRMGEIPEVTQATFSSAGHGATGPDGIPIEVSLCANELLSVLITGILQRGRFPKPMQRLYSALWGKVGNPPNECGPKRPISLICVISEMLGNADRHRILPAVEVPFDTSQYAFRRSRGAGMRLSEMMEAQPFEAQIYDSSTIKSKSMRRELYIFPAVATCATR